MLPLQHLLRAICGTVVDDDDFELVAVMAGIHQGIEALLKYVPAVEIWHDD
jgi:hypothetical protein